MWSRICVVFLWSFCIAAWFGCSSPPTTSQEISSENTTSSTQEPHSSPTDGGVGSSADADVGSESTPSPVTHPTYFGHIKAIVEQNCTVCHQYGGLGPFSLTEFDQLLTFKSVVKSSVLARRMPPWQADPNCNQYSNDFSMPQRDIDLLVKWLDGDTAKGEPSSYQRPAPNTSLALPRTDLKLKMKEPYTPSSSRVDVYRCFVIDWPEQQTRFVTGFRVQPGNPETVHHLIVYLAGPKDAAIYVNEDAKDKENGYDCYGGPGGDKYPGLLGAWAPGTPATTYPKGTGLRVEPGSKLILQVHYNILKKAVAPDQSVVELMVEDKVDQEAMIAPFVNPVWLINRQTMKLPQGESQIRLHFDADLTTLTGGGTITVYGAALHMHALGKTGTLKAKFKDGKEQCMLHIPRWDFNWQSSFLLKQPITVKEGDKIWMECLFDNSADNQPMVDGIRQKPRDVFWGAASSDEMCLGFLYITCKDGDGKPGFCFDF